MATSLMTVLGVEGDLYYTACSVCSTKVDITPSNRGWCRRCGVRTHSPNIRYRLALRVSERSVPTNITVYGYRADKLFGCPVSLFLRKVKELKLTDEQVISAVQRSLLSEVIKVTRSGNTVTSAVFAVENNSKTIIDQVQALDSSTGSHYSPLPNFRSTRPTPNLTNSSLVPDKPQSVIVSGRPQSFFNSEMDKSRSPLVLFPNTKSSLVAKEPKSLLTKTTEEQKSPFMSPSNNNCGNMFQNSTPLFSQLNFGAMKSDELSPIFPDSACQVPNRDDSNHPTGYNSNHSTSRLLRLGKRRRCRVQKIVKVPPTQNASFSSANGINPPGSCQSENENFSTFRTKSSSSLDSSGKDEIAPDFEKPEILKPFDVDDIDVVVDLMKSDDFSLFNDEDKENINNVDSQTSFYKDNLNRSAAPDGTPDVTNSQDFDSFNVDELSLQDVTNVSTNSHSTGRGATSTSSFKAASPNLASPSSTDLFETSVDPTQPSSQPGLSVDSDSVISSPNLIDYPSHFSKLDMSDQGSGSQGFSDRSAELF